MYDPDVQELSEEEKRLISSFRQLHLQPKADTPEDLVSWMSHFTKGATKKEEEGAAMFPPLQPTLPSTLTLTQPPRLPSFSGDGKGDVDFDQWKHELECLANLHEKSVLSEAVRRSLRGKAARVAMHVDKTASLERLIEKLDSVFGEVKLGHTIMATFYTAKQNEGESVADWACRLEDILCKAVAAGKVDQHETEALLRNTFWTGLRPELRDLSGHKFDKNDIFEDFVRVMRQVEEELHQRKAGSLGKLPTPGKAAVSPENSEIQDIRGILKQMSVELKSLKQHQTITDSKPKYQPDARTQGITSVPQWHSTSLAAPQHNEPVCFRCGQPGHIKKGCRTRLYHHTSRPLNGRPSMGRGKP